MKCAVRPLDIDCVNKGDLDLSKGVVWATVGQRAAVLQAVKVEAQKNNSANQPCAGNPGSNRGDWQIFFKSPTLTTCKTAAL